MIRVNISVIPRGRRQQRKVLSLECQL